MTVGQHILRLFYRLASGKQSRDARENYESAKIFFVVRQTAVHELRSFGLPEEAEVFEMGGPSSSVSDPSRSSAALIRKSDADASRPFASLRADHAFDVLDEVRLGNTGYHASAGSDTIEHTAVELLVQRWTPIRNRSAIADMQRDLEDNTEDDAASQTTRLEPWTFEVEEVEDSRPSPMHNAEGRRQEKPPAKEEIRMVPGLHKVLGKMARRWHCEEVTSTDGQGVLFFTWPKRESKPAKIFNPVRLAVLEGFTWDTDYFSQDILNVRIKIPTETSGSSSGMTFAVPLNLCPVWSNKSSYVNPHKPSMDYLVAGMCLFFLEYATQALYAHNLYNDHKIADYLKSIEHIYNEAQLGINQMDFKLNVQVVLRWNPKPSLPLHVELSGFKYWRYEPKPDTPADRLSSWDLPKFHQQSRAIGDEDRWHKFLAADDFNTDAFHIEIRCLCCR